MTTMDKRLQEHIEELLRLYDEARTTDEQERELAEFFRQTDDVPEAWKGYAQLFAAFAENDSLFTETELDELLPHRRPTRPLWPWMLGAAATVALLIGLFLHYPQGEATRGEFGQIKGEYVEMEFREEPFFVGVSKLNDSRELAKERDEYLTFSDRVLYGRKAGGGSTYRPSTNYTNGDSIQAIPTNTTTRIGYTNKSATSWDFQEDLRRESNQTWEHRELGYDWSMTPYHKYQETLLEKLGISIAFPEPAVRYFSHNGAMEDWAHFTFGVADASGSTPIFDCKMFVQMSPDFCIVLQDIENSTGWYEFEYREQMVKERKLSINTHEAHFDYLIRNNCDVPWTGWYDYSGEDLRKLEEWNGADFILRFKEAAWVKRSNAEAGFIVKFPNFHRIRYNYSEPLDETNIGSSYNAGFGVELVRLYNPLGINMLFFINTEKEKDILKCVEEACRYVSFDNSHIKYKPKEKKEEKGIDLQAPDPLNFLDLETADRMLYGRKAG